MTNEVKYNPCRYVGNGTTKKFPFDWKIITEKDIVITLENISTEEQTTLEYGKDYSVIFSEVGGEVTFTTAPSSAYKVIISRDVSEYQSTRYSTSPGFQSSEVEKSFDKVSCEIQEILYTLARAIKVKLGSSNLELTIPEPSALKTLIWNKDGTALENSDISINDIDSASKKCEDEANKASTFATDAQQSATSAETSKNAILNDKGYIAVTNDLLGKNNIKTCADNMEIIKNAYGSARQLNENTKDIANLANIVSSLVDKVIEDTEKLNNSIQTNDEAVNKILNKIIKQVDENTKDIANLANIVSSLVEAINETGN